MKKILITSMVTIIMTLFAYFNGYYAGKNNRPTTPKEVYSIMYYGSQPDKTTVEACKSDPDYCMDVTSNHGIEAAILKIITSK